MGLFVNSNIGEIADLISAEKAHPRYKDSNGNWMIWNSDTGSYSFEDKEIIDKRNKDHKPVKKWYEGVNGIFLLIGLLLAGVMASRK